jgi:hypothetical protein
LNNRNIKIRHLSCGAVTDDAALMITGFGIHLLWLNIVNLFVTDVCLIRIAEGCHSLRRLYVSGNNDITDIGMIRVAECCPSMVSLTLSGCTEVTDMSVICIAECCCNIEMLDIFG